VVEETEEAGIEEAELDQMWSFVRPTGGYGMQLTETLARF